jgi:hypothetical protein
MIAKLKNLRSVADSHFTPEERIEQLKARIWVILQSIAFVLIFLEDFSDSVVLDLSMHLLSGRYHFRKRRTWQLWYLCWE